MEKTNYSLVDCDNKDDGCGGGLMEKTFQWIKENDGLQLESDYPYFSYQKKCTQDKEKLVVKVDSFVILDSEDEEVIKDYLYKTGPLAIAVNDSLLQYYTGGIVDAPESSCDPEMTHHAAALVGY